MIALRLLISIAVLPGLVAIALPWIIVGNAPPIGSWLGLVPIAFGVALSIWCVLLFARAGRGTPAPWDPPRRFVAVGPYRAVRNPMYLGVGSVILGEALLFGSWSLAAYLAVVAVVWHLFVVAYEEPTLERQFGEEYRRYRTSVPRWLPRLT